MLLSSGLGVWPFRLYLYCMLTYSKAFYQIKDQLQPLYDEHEASAIAHLFREFITGLGKMARLDKKDTPFSKRQQDLFTERSKDLIKGKPIQYVTNSGWFMGREFVVNENVLIPRPETEELVQWIVDDHSGDKNTEQLPVDTEIATPKIRILDVGSGSGCIAISLGWLLPRSIITCVDISKEALDVALTNIQWVLTEQEKRSNADNIRLIELDFLDETIRNKDLGRFDIIVSNPPYIPYTEKANMHANVRDYEPVIALFVPASDALVFYKALAESGKLHLKQDGYIYCELDAAHAMECKLLFENAGYQEVEIKKDMHGNWRMLKAGKLKNEA